MKKILPVIVQSILKPLGAQLLRILANKLAGRKKKSAVDSEQPAEITAEPGQDLSVN